MAYNFTKRNSLLTAALGVSLFAGAGAGWGSQTQGSSGQSGQSGQTDQSGQSGQSGAAQPGVAHPNQPDQGSDGPASKASVDKKTANKKTDDKKASAKNNSNKNGSSNKQSKKDARASKKDPKTAAKDTKDANNANRKAARANSARSKKAAAEKGANPSKGGATESKEASAEPDKVLYDRAMADVKKSRYTEGRLSLQTLINTYPDSEYLAKAKLAVADSYYKEGGTSNLTQSIQEYIDFQTFFPFLDEAAYAQMQVGMAHYKMMEKSDRDSSQAIGAEDAFQTFLLKYPTNPLAPQAEQKLREVQEVLADGQFRIARFYYVKQDYRAAAARLVEVTDRYPLYSGSDEALWMLGNVYVKAKQVSKNEDDKNHWSDLAGKCYTRIARDYPLSKYSAEAKARLSSVGMPVPQADANAVARMQKEQLYAKAHHESIIKKAPVALLKSNPDVSTAAHAGAPNLNPPTDTVSATDVLKPGAAGPSFGIGASATAGDGGSVGSVSSGDTVPAAPQNDPGLAAGAQIISTGGAPVANTQVAAPAEQPSGPPMEGTVLKPASPGAAASSPAPAAGAPTTNAPTSAPPANPPTNPTGANSSGSAPAPAPGSSDTSQPAASGQPANGQQPSSSSSSGDSSQESSSKKKKGLKKLIPF